MLETVKKVLLIDDDPHQLFAASLIVKRFGFEVVTAGDGASGLERAREDLPDIIVCDIMMPTPNGFELKALLAADPRTAEIPFIFLTARVFQADKLAALDHGVDDYITKPFNPDELAARIRAVLRRYETGRRQGRMESAEKTELLWRMLAETAQLVGKNAESVEQLELFNHSEEVWNLCSRADFENRLDTLEGQLEFPLAMTCFGLTGLRALEAPAANHLLAQVLDTLLGVLDLDAQLYRLGPEHFAILMQHDTPRLHALDVALHANLALARDVLGPATPVLCLGTVIAEEGDHLREILRQAEHDMEAMALASEPAP